MDTVSIFPVEREDKIALKANRLLGMLLGMKPGEQRFIHLDPDVLTEVKTLVNQRSTKYFQDNHKIQPDTTQRVVVEIGQRKNDSSVLTVMSYKLVG